MNKIVVYTCIIGDYDTLKPVCNRSSRIDYICFTDNPNIKSDGVWEIRRLPPDDLYTEGLSKIKKQRIVKILPHIYLKEYDVSIWVDGNIQITGNLIFEFLNALDLNNNFMYVNRHPSRDCIYREEVVVLRQKKDIPKNTNPQIRRYKEEGFPEHFGLAETNIIVRKHNDFRCKKLMFDWAKEIINGSHRDQLSFDYCRWKNGMSQFIGWIEENLHYTSKTACFRIYSHGQNPVKLVGTTMLPHVIIHKYEIDEKQKLEEEKKKLEEEKKKLIEEQKKKEEEFKKKLEEEKQKMLEEQLQKIEELEDKQEELEAEKEKTDEKLIFLIKKLEITKNQLKALEELNRKFNELNKKYDLEKVNSEKIIEKFKTDKKLLIDTIENLKVTIKEEKEKEKTKEENKKMCIYTCITGEYDVLKPLPVVPNGWDLICFTDNMNIPTFNQWKLRPIPYELRYLSNTKTQRFIKILPHKFLKEYDISLWVDANIEIVDNLEKLFKKYDLNENFIYIGKHPGRNCIYDEAKACLEKGKETKENIEKLINAFQAEGYPKANGLVESGIMLRKHNDPNCIKLMDLWAEKIINLSKRDQLSFNYCCWKLHLKYGMFDQTIMRRTKMPLFKIKCHKKTAIHEKPFVIATCNYNTTRLTNVWLKSVLKHCKQDNIKIIIFDNSDAEPFTTDIVDDRINILDNTSGKIIDYAKEISEHGAPISYVNWANLKHTIAIQWMLDNLETDDMILFDSDTILKVPITSDFIDSVYITKADVQKEDRNYPCRPLGKRVIRYGRFIPFIQYFNLKLIRKNRIRYLDDSRIISGKNDNTFSWDTGSAFYADVINSELPYKILQHTAYIQHLQGASWAKVYSEEQFINDNRIYWD